MKLKGTTLIQLFDAKSGKEVQRVKYENMLTNAMSSLLNKCPYELDRRTCGALTTETRDTDYSSIYDKIFGGLLLFPNSLTENADHLYEPLSHYPTGYASMLGTDDTDTKRGTYDGIASHALANGGFQYIYEFGSSYGNGTISAVALTSAKGGAGYFSKMSFVDSFFYRELNTSQRRLLGVTDTHIYYAKWNGAIARIPIVPYTLPFTGNSLFDTNAEETSITLDKWTCIDSANNTLIQVSGTTTLTITTYDLSDLTASPTTTTLSINDAIPTASVYQCIFAKNGNYFYIGDRSTTVYKIDTTNGANQTEITVPAVPSANGQQSRTLTTMSTGDIFATNCFIDSNDAVHEITDYGNYLGAVAVFRMYGVWGIRGNRSYPYQANSSGYGGTVISPYLATINNLDSAIVKDASKTLRVTYTVEPAGE